MKSLSSIVLAICLIACGPDTSQTNNDEHSAEKDSDFKVFVKPEEILEQNSRVIIFGHYCGNCRGSCSSMYRYYMRGVGISGNANSLSADYTDSFWHKEEKGMKFETELSSEKYAIAHEIVNNIPEKLFSDTLQHQRFGCPDCRDQCGLYLEIHTGGPDKQTVKKYDIDTDTAGLDGKMKAFSLFLKDAISRMKE